jgi:hypothetical protein
MSMMEDISTRLAIVYIAGLITVPAEDVDYLPVPLRPLSKEQADWFESRSSRTQVRVIRMARKKAISFARAHIRVHGRKDFTEKHAPEWSDQVFVLDTARDWRDNGRKG